MMDLFTREDLRRLAQTDAQPCISLYMPTHRTGREIREDSLRCKNLATEAERQLEQQGCRGPEARKIVEPIKALHADGEFWKDQSDGLAIFAAPGQCEIYRLPMPFDESVVVNSQFDLRPILPLLQGDGRFYLLAASQKRVRLFEGTHYNISELLPENLPRNLRDALNIDEYVQALQYHSSGSFAPGAGHENAPMYHGQGASDADVKKKDELRQYFLQIDAALRSFFHDDRTPLVFAGVEYLFPIFREACDYRGLQDQAVRGNPDGLSAQQLHQQAWAVVAPAFQQRLQDAREKFANGAAHDLTVRELDQVLAAAREGRIETLFVARHQHAWGQVDGSGEVTRAESAEGGNEDLLVRAVVDTLLSSGQVYALDQADVPEGHLAVALLRYRSGADQKQDQEKASAR